MEFREQVEKAVSTGSAWKLAKWARRQAGEVIETPQIPTLIWDNTVAMDNVQKAELLAEKFFPTLPEIDLTDMESSRSRPTFEVSSEITKEDVKAQIKRTAPDKAPGHDKIPNRFWKLTADVVSEHLAKLFSKCLEAGVCPAHFKKSITVVLRKERKENYQVVSAYRPIALLNTIGKLLEAISAKRLHISCARRTQTPARIPNGSEERKVNSDGTAITNSANPHHMGSKEKPSSKHVVPRYGGSV